MVILNFVEKRMIRNLGRIKDFGEGGPADPVSTSIPSPVSPRSPGDIEPRKSFKLRSSEMGFPAF